jgi:precorrin-6A/cobalt-precorrin-6A reductase
MIASARHPLRLLLLGGTTEASLLARALAGRDDLAPVLSLAGRTQRPELPALPHRIGGFGGAEGLGAYLESTGTQAVIDATHPFAARISAHAATACARLGLPLATFTRPPWRAEHGDRWTDVPDLDAAALALGPAPRRVFLTTGRLGLKAFLSAPQHHYLVRTIDPPAPEDLPPDHELRLGRGPFSLADEIELMREARIEVLVTKNSGGAASGQKLLAARSLALRMIVVERPPATGGIVLADLAAAIEWIEAHRTAP